MSTGLQLIQICECLFKFHLYFIQQVLPFYLLSSQLSCPCDVYPGINYHHAYRDLPANDNWTPEISRAPRESIFGSQASKYSLASMYNNEPGREKWFNTQGRVYEYEFLYHKVPDKDNWFWKYYPSTELQSSE